MNIKQQDKETLKHIVTRYGEIHAEIRKLEKKISDMFNDRNLISEELNTLRESEISLINKIEEESGNKLTQTVLTKIINS